MTFFFALYNLLVWKEVTVNLLHPTANLSSTNGFNFYLTKTRLLLLFVLFCP